MNWKSRGENVEEYTLIYQVEHGAGLCVREEKDGPDIWLPLSQIQYDEHIVYKRGSYIKVTIPDWLAEEHDLV